MLSVGIDLAEIPRIKKAMENPRFLSRILGPAEYAQLESRGFPVQSVAASFAAKEAFSKAVGTGISGFALGDVQLLRLPNGRPTLELSGKALALADGWELSVSVTHTQDTAGAVVVMMRGG